MKVCTDTASWQTQQKARELARRIDRKSAELLKSRVPVDGVIKGSTDRSDGVLIEHTRKTTFKLEVDQTGKLESYQEKLLDVCQRHYERTDSLQVRPDGTKTYQSRLFYDDRGQIESTIERLTVAADGTENYEVKPNASHNFTNWVRRNRSLQTLAGLGLGGGLGAVLGHAVGGLSGAALGGMLGANLADLCVRPDQKYNNASTPSRLDSAIWQPVDQLRTGINIGGAIAGFGLLLMAALAISR